MCHVKEARHTALMIAFPLHPQTLVLVQASGQDSIFCGFQKKNLCIARESNPGHQNGNLVWCLYTSNACLPNYSSQATDDQSHIPLRFRIVFGISLWRHPKL